MYTQEARTPVDKQSRGKDCHKEGKLALSTSVLRKCRTEAEESTPLDLQTFLERQRFFNFWKGWEADKEEELRHRSVMLIIHCEAEELWCFLLYCVFIREFANSFKRIIS